MKQFHVSGRQKTNSETRSYLQTAIAIERPSYLSTLTLVNGIASSVFVQSSEKESIIIMQKENFDAGIYFCYQCRVSV